MIDCKKKIFTIFMKQSIFNKLLNIVKVGFGIKIQT